MVSFPAGQAAQAHISSGQGPVTLNLPAGLAVRLSIRSGQTHLRLPASLTIDRGPP